MKIIYATTEGFDFVTGNTHLNYTMINEMLKRNHSIELIQSSRTGNIVFPDEFAKDNRIHCTTIKRTPCNKSNFIGRALEEVQYYWHVSKEVKKVTDADVIFYQASGFTFFFVYLIRKCGVPIVLNIQDVFPDSIRTTGVCTNPFILNVFYWLQNRMFKRLAHVTVLSEDMKENIVNRYSIDPAKVSVVYNWFDEENVREVPLADNKFAKKFDLKKNKFVVQYAGNLGYVLDYNAFIEVGKKLMPYKDIVIQIIGNGSCEQVLKKRAREEKLDNFEFIDLQPLELVTGVYSYCDVCYIPLKKDVIYHSVPSKASIVTACKRPVILVCNTDSQYGKLFEQSQCGCICSYEEIDRAVEYILRMKSDAAFYEKEKQNSYQLACSKLSSSVNCVKEIQLLECVAKMSTAIQ